MLGWGWLMGDPVAEARLAARIVKDYRLDGYIANAEVYYENDGFWKSKPFVQEFRRLLPNIPLGLSYVGYGYPHRNLDFNTWAAAGAAFLPQCYDNSAPGGKGRGHSVAASIDAADRAGLARKRVMPTVATSDMAEYYSFPQSAAEMLAAGTKGMSVWALESTTDDALRVFTPLSIVS